MRYLATIAAVALAFVSGALINAAPASAALGPAASGPRRGAGRVHTRPEDVVRAGSVPRKPQGAELHQTQTEFNTQLSKIRAAVERTVAHLKTWRMLSEEEAAAP